MTVCFPLAQAFLHFRPHDYDLDVSEGPVAHYRSLARDLQCEAFLEFVSAAVFSSLAGAEVTGIFRWQLLYKILMSMLAAKKHQ